MGEVIPLPERLDRRSLEKNLRLVEKYIPYLRKHIQEAYETPDYKHRAQALNTISQIRMALDYVVFHLQPKLKGPSRT